MIIASVRSQRSSNVCFFTRGALGVVAAVEVEGLEVVEALVEASSSSEDSEVRGNGCLIRGAPSRKLNGSSSSSPVPKNIVSSWKRPHVSVPASAMVMC